MIPAISATTRKLATIRIASNVFPIEGADKIVAVQIDGWVCVAKKEEFSIGTKGVYFEIDSFLPAADPRFGFLSKQFINFEGKLGARLRTIRLKKQLSQGLFLPLSIFPEFKDKELGANVTAELGIDKWELPAVEGTMISTIGYSPFPEFIPKTDQPRVQNLITDLIKNYNQEFEVTIKLDGSSMTVYRNGDKTGVCSRNLEVKEDLTDLFWISATENRLIEALHFIGRNLAFQGELIGEKMQGNPEKLAGRKFYVFDIYDIDQKKHLSPVERQEIMRTLKENKFDIQHVPILDNLILHHTVNELLEMADGPSLNPKQKREGLVFKRLDGKFSFKVISNWYLEKNKDS